MHLLILPTQHQFSLNVNGQLFHPDVLEAHTLCFHTYRDCHSSICANTWFVNELLITKDGWPVAQPDLPNGLLPKE